VNVTGANPNIVVVAGAVVILAVLGMLGALVWHGSVSGTQAMLVISPIAVAAVAIFGTHLGVTAGAKAQALKNQNPTA
jgi:hypothetical protein